MTQISKLSFLTSPSSSSCSVCRDFALGCGDVRRANDETLTSPIDAWWTNKIHLFILKSFSCLELTGNASAGCDDVCRTCGRTLWTSSPPLLPPPSTVDWAPLSERWLPLGSPARWSKCILLKSKHYLYFSFTLVNKEANNYGWGLGGAFTRNLWRNYLLFQKYPVNLV